MGDDGVSKEQIKEVKGIGNALFEMLGAVPDSLKEIHVQEVVMYAKQKSTTDLVVLFILFLFVIY